jgi:hypothetical protein
MLALLAMPGTVTGHSEDRTNSGKAYFVAVKVSFWDGATTWLLVEGLAVAPANCVGLPPGRTEGEISSWHAWRLAKIPNVLSNLF